MWFCKKGYITLAGLIFLSFFVVFNVYAQDYHTIYEIQGQQAGSPYEGEIVTTRGIVTAVFNPGFFIEEQPGGEWRGLYIYTGSVSSVERGDSVEIVGEVDEYFSTTEIVDPSVTVISSGHDLPGVVDTLTSELGQEKYEGVFVSVNNVAVTDTSAFGQYDEWFIDDGSGELMVDYTLMIGKQGDYQYEPNPGDTIFNIDGILHYSYYNYKIVPRADEDLQLNPFKTKLYLAPEKYVAGGESPVWLRVYFPDSAEPALKSLKMYINKVIGWEIDSVNVTGDGTESAVVNVTDSILRVDSLDVASSALISMGVLEMPDTTGEFSFKVEAQFGSESYQEIKPSPLLTLISRPDSLLTISEVQGEGFESPYSGREVWIKGIITTPNFSDEGYSGYIQDSTGGINVYSGNESSLKYGYKYLMYGEIEEYNGLTEFVPESDSVILLSTINNPVKIDTLDLSSGLSEEVEGELVAINEAVVIEPPGVPAGGGYNAVVRNGQTALNLRIESTTGIVDSIDIENLTRWNITGVVGQYDSEEPYTTGYQLLPRFVSDFDSIEMPEEDEEFSVVIDPNPFAPDKGEITTITVKSPGNYRVNAWIYDTRGREVKRIITNHPGPAEVNWLGKDMMDRRVTIGTYLLHVEAVSPLGKVSSITRPIVVATELGG